MTRLIKCASGSTRTLSRTGLSPRCAEKQRLHILHSAHQDLISEATAGAPYSHANAEVTYSEIKGVRYLHFGTVWSQGAMRITHPYQLVLEYCQQMMIWMLFLEKPKRILQLGLGSGSLTKFVYRFFPRAQVDVVDLNPTVIFAARKLFALPPNDARLTVHEGDAGDFVHQPEQQGKIDVLQIDLYDAAARGPVLDSIAFYQAAKSCLNASGMLAVNLFGEDGNIVRNTENLNTVFEQRVFVLPKVETGNYVALAFCGPPLEIPFKNLQTRAQFIETKFDLPALSWVNTLKELMGGNTNIFTI